MKIEFVAAAFTILAIVAAEETTLLDALPILKHGTSAMLTVFALGLLYHGLKDPLVAQIGRLRRPRPLVSASGPVTPTDEWLTLADAARKAMDHAYSTMSGSILEGAWRKLSNDETDLLHFWAYRVTAQLAVPLWGTKILSSRVELIPLDDLQGAHFRERATRVDLGSGEPMTDFENLRVKRRDLDAGLAQIASRNWQPDQQA